jgi:hypothetical protein
VSKDAQRQKSAGSNYGHLRLPKGIHVYSPTPGATEKIDIIPYVVSCTNHKDLDVESEIAVKGSIWYKKPYMTHRQVGADNDTVVCLQTFGKKCPICEYRKKRAKEGADKEELKAYNTSQRNLYVVIPKGVKGKPEEYHIFDMSQFLFQNLLTEEISENEDFGMFPDLEEGLTLKVRWNEEAFAGNKYAEAGRIDFIKRVESYEQEIVDEAPNLDTVLIELSYAAMQAKFMEEEIIEEELDEEEETIEEVLTPRKRKSVEEEDVTPQRRQISAEREPAPKRKPVVEEEEEIALTWADLKDMEGPELAEVVETYSLDIDLADYDEDEKGLRIAIAEEMEIEIPKKPAATKPAAVLPAKGATKPAPASVTKAGKCPYGFKYGVDTDTKDQCDDCTLWSQCIEEKER